MRDQDLRDQFDQLLRPIREAPPPGLPVITRRVRRRRWRAAAGAAATAALAGAAVAVYLTAVPAPPPTAGHSAEPSISPGTSSAEPSASPSGQASAIPGGLQVTSTFTIPAPVGSLVVRSGVGQVTVVGGGGSAVTVTQRLRYSQTRPSADHAVTGRTLTLTSACPAQRMCSVDFVVHVPRGLAVQVSCQIGEIRLSRLAGDVTARTGTGDIFARHLRGGTVVLGTGTGEINAGFAAPPSMLRATANTGEVVLDLPGAVSYRVSARVGTGQKTVAVPERPSSDHVIVARTGTGNLVIVAGAPAA